MRFYKMMGLSLIVFSVSACTQPPSNTQYLSTPVTASLKTPAGAMPIAQEPYYRVPPVSSSHSAVAPPSIQPPTVGQATAVRSSATTQASTPKRTTLILKPTTAMAQLTAALNKDPDLKIIDQDNDAKTIYTLYTKQTSGNINQKTPAYLIVLQPIEAGYLVTVTNKKAEKLPVSLYNDILQSLKTYL